MRSHTALTTVLLAVVALAGCDMPSAGGSVLSGGATDPDRVVVVQKAYGDAPRDPKWIYIYETAHTSATNALQWAKNPAQSDKEKLLRSANIVESPSDSEPVKQMHLKMRMDRDAAKAALPAAFELWQKGEFSAAFQAFRDAANKKNGDNPYVWFYLAESAYKINRYLDAFHAYRNVIALAPASKEGLSAKGRLDEFFTNPMGGLREPVFAAAIDNGLCMGKYLLFDQMRNAGYSAPSARRRYQTSLVYLGASNTQMDVAMEKYRELATSRRANMKLAEAAMDLHLETYKGFLPLLGWTGITDNESGTTRAQCPLGLTIMQTKYSGKPAYQVAKGTYPGDPGDANGRPEVSFGQPEYVALKDQIEMP